MVQVGSWTTVSQGYCETRWVKPVYSEEESQSSHGLLPARKLLHVAESLHGRHSMVFDPSIIRFLQINEKRTLSAADCETHLAVFQTKVCDASHR